MKRILVLLGVVFTLGCKSQDSKPSDFVFGEIISTSKNYLFPKDLKSEIEKEYVKYMKSLGAPYDIQSEQELLLQVPREYLDLQVYLWAKSELTISKPVKFSLPRGGGGIDLRDYVKSRKGSFFIDFEVVRTEKPDEPAQPLKVYYLSNAKRRVIAGEKFGAGCDTYMDISRIVSHKMGNGIQVNATDERHVSALSGVYYFVSFQPERIYLAALHLEDSRFPQHVCQQPIAKGEE